MAKFKIDFLAFNDFYGNTPTYLPSTLVDFDSQEQKAGVGITHTDQVSYVLAAEKKFRKLKDASQYLAVPPNTIVGRNFSYCYNEKFTKSQNASKTLSFSMDAVRRQGNELFLNPFVQILKVGDLLLLTDKYGNEYLFNVTGVSISFRQNNKVYDYSCQDAFSFQLARQNKDYSITNDSSSTSFIGSKTLDYWANKIDKECHIPYQFIPFACGLYENALGQVFKFDTLPIPGRGKDDKDLLTQGNVIYTKIVKPFYDSASYPEYFETFAFSISGSTAKQALVSLGDKFDRELHSYEHVFYNQQKVCIDRYFWFLPKKNRDRKTGLKFSPYYNIKNFSLSSSGSELTTILNVKSNTLSDGSVLSMFPPITPFFSTLFASKAWADSEFYDGYFSSVCKGQTFHLIENFKKEGSGDTARFASETFTFGWQNSVIQVHSSSELAKKLAKCAKFYNKIAFTIMEKNNAAKTSRAVASQRYDAESKIISTSNTSVWKLQINNKTYCQNETIEADDLTSLTDDKTFQFAITVDELLSQQNQDFLNGASIDIYLRFYRDASQQDIDFATVADAAPWLENKLFDMSYFSQYYSKISKEQRERIRDWMENKRRIVNGRLLTYSNQYYSMFQTQTKVLSGITSQLDELGGRVQLLVDDKASSSAEGDDKSALKNDLSSFKEGYDNVFNNQGYIYNQALVSYNNLIGKYGREYFLANQAFLKNLYNFVEYYNSVADSAELGVAYVSSSPVSGETKRIKADTSLSTGSRQPLAEKDLVFDTKGRYIGGLLYVKPNNSGGRSRAAANSEGNSYASVNLVTSLNYDDYRTLDISSSDLKRLPSGTYAYDPTLVYYDKDGNEITFNDFIKRYITSKPANEYYQRDYDYREPLYSQDDNGKWRCSFFSFFEKAPTPLGTSVTAEATEKRFSNERGEKFAIRSWKGRLEEPKEEEDPSPQDETLWNSYEEAEGTINNDGCQFLDLFADSIYAGLEHGEDGSLTNAINYDLKLNGSNRTNLSSSNPYLPRYWFSTDENGDVGKRKKDVYHRFLAECYIRNFPITTIYKSGEALPLAGAKTQNSLYHYTDKGREPILSKAGTFKRATSAINLTEWDLDLKEGYYFKNKSHSGVFKVAPTYTALSSKDDFYYEDTEDLTSYTYKTTWLRPVLFPVGDIADLTKYISPDDDYYILPLMEKSYSFGHAEELSDELEFPFGALCEGKSEGIFKEGTTEFNPSRFNAKPVGGNNENVLISADVVYPVVRRRIKVHGSNLINQDFDGQPRLKELNNPSSLRAIDNFDENYFRLGNKCYIVIGLPDTFNGTIDHFQCFEIFHIENYGRRYGSDCDYSLPFYNFDNDTVIDFAQKDDLIESSDESPIWVASKRIKPVDGLDNQTGTTETQVLKQSRAVAAAEIPTPTIDSKSVLKDSADLRQGYTAKQILAKSKQGQSFYSYIKDPLEIPCFCAVDNGPVSLSIPYSLINSTSTSDDVASQMLMQMSKGNLGLTFSKTTVGGIPYYEFKSSDFAVSIAGLGSGTSTSLNAPVIKITSQTQVDKNGNVLSDKNQPGAYTKLILNRSLPYNNSFYKANREIRFSNAASSGLTEQKTNGEIWFNWWKSSSNNGTSTPDATSNQQARAIETQLETYWNTAYVNSKNSRYFLPEHWQPRADGAENAFSVAIIDQNTGKLKQDFIPKISMVQNTKDGTCLVPYLTFKYEPLGSLDLGQSAIGDDDASELSIGQYIKENSHNYRQSVEAARQDNPAIDDFISALPSSRQDGWTFDSSIEGGVTTSYYYVCGGGGCLWQDFIGDYVAEDHTRYERLDAYDLRLLSILSAYKQAPVSNYEKALQQHDDYWNRFYASFPSLFLESTYEDADATTSKELYEAAQVYRNSLKAPDYTYNISTIDINSLQGYDDEDLDVGDPIELDAQDFITTNDSELLDRLQQYLFISSISYTLRSDSEIQLSVNTINYQDKRIRQLVKFIR